MELDKYLERIYRISEKLPYQEDEDISNLINKICVSENIKFKEIYSDYAFPRTITIGSERVLLWEGSYWAIYKKFILGMFALDLSEELSKFELKRSSLGLICESIYYFMALKFRGEPKLAYVFSKYYNEFSTMSGADIWIQEERIKTIFEYVEISKIYCSIHEISHCFYENDEKRLEKESQELNTILDVQLKVLEIMGEEEYKQLYNFPKEDFIQAIELCKNKKSMKLEILCDTYGFNHCFNLYMSVWKNKYSKKEIFDKCNEAIAILSFFNQCLTILMQIWREKYKLYQSGQLDYESKTIFNEVNDSTLMRYYIKEMVACVQGAATMSKDDIGTGENCLLFNLSNKNILEGYIENMFLSRESCEMIYSEINQVEEIDSEELINQYERYLQW